MPFLEALQESQRRFLEQIQEQTGGDPAVNVSMYAIGEQLNLDRDSAKHTAESLIGFGFVEIRTLAGAIGITPEGVDAVQSGQDPNGPAPPGTIALGEKRVPDAPALGTLETLMGALGNRTPDLGLSFEELGELMADIKSIDAQLSSPKPKTAVFRACLESIRDLLEKAGEKDCRTRIQGLLGNRKVS
ncbi:MAG: hypothetical protein JRI76_01285 [Deltaproteobacteria bacterium]|nr:hypothetical protein [Deltaproteobacteria bacterium]MBW1956015.1 hypothetical protein [Deltaproteobacteria bacterium]MBW2040642.1 hypothetical protein [Deltaproteobacteria bacterium]MBW2132466.1 hypothetical protein [Deltaproteobacteria bacterium]